MRWNVYRLPSDLHIPFLSFCCFHLDYHRSNLTLLAVQFGQGSVHLSCIYVGRSVCR